MTVSPSHRVAATGIFLVLFPLYVFTSPGRIDSVDGQIRYEVARNWITTGDPAVRDPRLVPLWLVVKTDHGAYGGYNAGATVAGIPAMLLSRVLPDHQAERDRFAFAMTGPAFGAIGMALLVLAYGMLGLSSAHAAAWAFAVGMTTLWWPASETVLDQNQHAVLLLATFLLAWDSGRRRRWRSAALGGLVAACLINYQENYALLLPFVGLAVFASPTEGTSRATSELCRRVDWDGIARYVVFGAVSATGLVLLFLYNYVRFGAAFSEGRFEHPFLFALGNPLAAALSFAVSPGRGIFFFSPPALLAVVGARALRHRAPSLFIAITGASIVHVLVIVQLAFFGGDWCWGPRYLLILVLLWALAFPFASARLGRITIVLLLAAGAVVQLLAITLDHQRFFFERNLSGEFWVSDPWFYFRESQLTARPRELGELLRNGAPPQAVRFTPSPTGEATYSPFGPPFRTLGTQWARSFSVFSRPRPWPFWVSALAPQQRPVAVIPLAMLAVMSAGTGCLLLRRAVDQKLVPRPLSPCV